MRPDMAKVVTEAPRRGHQNPNKKTALRIRGRMVNDDDVREDFDSGPRRAKMTMNDREYDNEDKSFSDVLGPLRKYLRKQVGRPWNTVYSELAATLDKRSLTGIHIWGHVASEVETQCYVGVDRKVYSRRPYHSWPVTGLYVHPDTGLLRYNADRLPWQRKLRTPVDVDVVKLDDGRRLERLHGLWFFCTYVRVEEVVPGGWNSYRVGGPSYYHEAKTTITHVQQQKRQLSKKELKTYGLKNIQAA